MDRRKLLRNIGTTTATGLAFGSAISTGSASSRNDTIVRIQGTDREKYIDRAFSEITTSDKYDTFASRLSRRGYSVGDAGAVVTRHSADGTTNVLLPLRDERNRLSIDTFDNYGKGENFGHVVWTSESDVHALVTGDTDALTQGVDLASNASIPDDGAGVEIIRPDEHKIEISSPLREFTTSTHERTSTEDTEITFARFDLTTKSVTTQTTSVNWSDIREARTTCPDSIPVILGAIASCGGACSTCPSAGLGNLPALFACIGCASCGCGLGCCIGERSSTACLFASTVLKYPFLFGAGPVSGAVCVNEGCNNNSCF